MLIINSETLNQARGKLTDVATRKEGIDTLKRILEIKETLLWRSEAATPCCGSLGGFACQLTEETSLLQEAINLLESNDLAGADPLLDRLSILISSDMRQVETLDLPNRLTATTDNV